MRNFAPRLWLKLAIVAITTVAVTAIAVPAHASKIGDDYIRYDCGSKYISSIYSSGESIARTNTISGNCTGHPGAGIIRSDGQWNATKWAGAPKELAQDKWTGKARGGHHYGCKSGCNAHVTGSR